MASTRLRTLLLYARRVPGLRGAIAETIGARLGALEEEGRPRSALGRRFAWLDRNAYHTLSYVNDWLEAFKASRELVPTALNISDLWQLRAARAQARRAELVVVLHSAAGDELSALQLMKSALQARRAPLVLFFGNEYTGMPEKIRYAREVGAEFVASQLPPPAAQWLYQELAGTCVLHAPHALNPRRYHPLGLRRDIAIGFRGDRYPLWIGDDARTRLIEWFAHHGAAHGLTVDIAFRRDPAHQWNEFLNRCEGIVGAESGTAYLERDDRTQRAVERYLGAHPAATFADVYAAFFRDYPHPVSGKAISSRHFEPIGTRTCQVLLEGEYNGILEADRHYLAVRRDFSNLDDVIARFRDPGVRARIVKDAWEHVRDHHTYAHRVAEVVRAVTAQRTPR